MTLTPVRLAISTCPNDTFAFHAILKKRIDLQGLEFQTQLLDISQLNEGLIRDQFEVAKASFHAAVKLSKQTVVLRSGSAIGFGVGPLLLAARADTAIGNVEGRPSVTWCPGELTTATMLFKLFHGPALADGSTRIEHHVFSEIMPALRLRNADFGVCIHEGRFTYQQQGLHLVEDLGTRWENETGAPLPLGGILASRRLSPELISRIQNVIRESIEFAMAQPDEALETMRQYAQEFDDQVLMKHVELYVNQWTIDLGETGEQALSELARQAVQCGLIDSQSRPLEICPK